jgi:hypothetical protein
MNPYNICVYNKIINVTQKSITWHVDNLKISYSRNKVINKVISYLESTYGTMNTSRGNKHQYLGMDRDYSTKGKVKVSMENFTQKTF